MFAYLAARNSADKSRSLAAISYFAEQFDVPVSQLRSIQLSDFQIDFFDTSNELSWYRDSRYVILLIGHLVNRDAIQAKLLLDSTNDAELILRLYNRGSEMLTIADGHLSFILFDAAEKKTILMGDRFHRYSVLYSINETIRVGSHSSLLYPFLASKSIDPDSYSQTIHFRWSTGERKLFQGIRQVLPGALVSIAETGAVNQSQYFNLAFDRRKNVDLDYWVDYVDSALDSCLSKIAQKHEVIGIPLSGGVDSTLLLAKAREHFQECVAVTARFLDGENPELENAQYVAKQLGVRHIVADLDAEYLKQMFPVMIRLHEQPPRNFSDIALARIFQELKGDVDAFLYGEGADTFFGLSAVHRIATADRDSALLQRLPRPIQRLLAQLVPGKTERLRRLKVVLEQGVDNTIYMIERIVHATPPHEIFNCCEISSIDNSLNQYLAHDALPTGDRASIQLLATGVMNHIDNTGRLASYHGLQMYVPFVMEDVREVALKLPFELQNCNGDFKRVLKELACRYIDREYIYAKKHGFPTPTVDWLNGPLRERVLSSAKGTGAGSQYYTPKSLSRLTAEEDFEHLWFAICMDEIFAQLSDHPLEVSVAA